jgi:hypothetical protein
VIRFPALQNHTPGCQSMHSRDAAGLASLPPDIVSNPSIDQWPNELLLLLVIRDGTPTLAA